LKALLANPNNLFTKHCKAFGVVWYYIQQVAVY